MCGAMAIQNILLHNTEHAKVITQTLNANQRLRGFAVRMFLIDFATDWKPITLGVKPHAGTNQISDTTTAPDVFERLGGFAIPIFLMRYAMSIHTIKVNVKEHVREIL